MKIKILFFGITTDLMGCSDLALDVEKKTTIAFFKSVIKKKYPQLQNIDQYAIAVNEQYVNNEFSLQENDVIAIIPPVSGG
ncbi:molybdopterin converting factor subunit 1 [Tenacibaculum sp. UWU-22]|uniref:molybdopterin converting factor subunit 1 n=1 Tax=Tenacibaculum sp. UWU-22 TaxID=3234187 RepID=UPI0034DB7BC9